MASDSIRAQESAQWIARQRAPALGLHLSAIERKTLLLAFDLLLLNLTFLISVTVWNEFALSIPAVIANVKWFLTLSAVWWTMGTVLDIYDLVRSASTSTIIANVGVSAILSCILYLAIPWLTPPLIRRVYMAGFVGLTSVVIVAWRVLYARLLVQPAFHQRGLILGKTATPSELIRAVREAEEDEKPNPFRGTGYRIAGLVTDGGPDGLGDDLPWLGHAENLVRLVRQQRIDEVITTFDNEAELSDQTREVLLDCRELGIKVSSLNDVYERLTGRLPVEYTRYDMHLLLSPPDNPATRLYRASKRLFDIFCALVGLAVLAVCTPWILLANALFSPGPLFFKQERLGRGGRPFTLYKLRSMIPDAERYTGAVWCQERDPRITPIGRFLRKSRLDELPQFINVLRGEMSLVGPRPERPEFVGQLAHAIPLYRARHAVKPGITGWAQVHYGYGSSVEDARVKLEHDLYYVKRASFYVDLLVLLHTVRVVLGLRGQ